VVIEKDGSISQAKVEHGLSNAVDKEAFRVVKCMPSGNQELYMAKLYA
jgi:hypothetical protein